MLDYHWARDLFSGIGIGNDYIPAMAPAILCFNAWCATYLFAIAFRSEPLRRLTQVLFGSTIACLAIGVTLLLGNGDVTLQTQSSVLVNGSENRLSWPSAVYWLIAAMGSLGLVPILLPKAWLRSGHNPRSAIESWLFYYTSMVLFASIPLLAVGYFGRENVSSFAYYRGPELRYGDVENVAGFTDLLNAGMEGSTGSNPEPVKILFKTGDSDSKDASLVATLNVSPMGMAVALKQNIRDYRSAYDQNQNRRYDLNLGFRYPPADPRHPARYISRTEADAGWFSWRYEAVFWRLGQALIAPYDCFDQRRDGNSSQNEYLAYLESAGELRTCEQSLRETLNTLVMAEGENSLFRFESPPKNQQSNSPVPGGDFYSRSIAITSLPTSTQRLILDASTPLVRGRSSNSRLDEQGRDLSESAEKSASSRLFDEHDRGELNRALLEAAFPQYIRGRQEIRRATLIEYDQCHRLLWFIIGGAVFLISSSLVSPNTFSMHDWYRDRLSMAYLAFDETRDVPFPKDHSSPLHSIMAHRHGGPFPLFVAAASAATWWKHAQQLSPRFDAFVMTPLTCGSRELGVRPTDDRGPLSEITVADTMAISAAALSPNYFVHHIVMAVMALLNCRLGLWLPRPRVVGNPRTNPTTSNLLYDEIQSNLAQRRSDLSRGDECDFRTYVLVTDGGHHENLGVEALLERRCRLIIVSDAGADPLHTFDDFASLLRRYESSTGTRFLEVDGDETLRCFHRLPVRGLSTDAENQVAKLSRSVETILVKAGESQTSAAARHFFTARIVYPDHQTGYLIYIKPCLTGDENLVIRNYAAKSAIYPHEPTSDQAFSYEQFEAYRHLGFHTGEDLARGFDESSRPMDFWSQDELLGTEDLIRYFMPRRSHTENLARAKTLLHVLKTEKSRPHDDVWNELEQLALSDDECARLILQEDLRAFEHGAPIEDTLWLRPSCWFRTLVRLCVQCDDMTAALSAAEWLLSLAKNVTPLPKVNHVDVTRICAALQRIADTKVQDKLVKVLRQLARDNPPLRNQINECLQKTQAAKHPSDKSDAPGDLP